MAHPPEPVPSWYLPWEAWLRAGHVRSRRPKSAPKRIPAWAWDLYAHRHPHHVVTPPPVPEKPPEPPKPAPSWTLRGPLILTASDPGSANGHGGVGSIGVIEVPGVAPLWKCTDGDQYGWLSQIEGDSQIDTAVELLTAYRQPGQSAAIVTTGNTPAKRLLEIGVNFAFAELNGQEGMEPYGNIVRMTWRAGVDGYPHVQPCFGCYAPEGKPAQSLGDYRDYIPLLWDDATNGWKRATEPQGLPANGAFACFSAEGMGDTNSWPALAGTVK